MAINGLGILWAVIVNPIALPPLYSHWQDHHITLQYGVERLQWEHLIGLPMTVGMLEVAFNDRIQVIKVILPTWASCQNPYPHITLSWVDGGAPIEANAMLLSGNYQQQSIEQEVIHTTIEWLDWKKSTLSNS